MSDVAELRQKFDSVWPLLDERTRRITAGNKAARLGYGGVSLVHRACVLSRKAAKGLKVTCRLACRNYSTGRKVSDQDMKLINVECNKFHGDWNYVIRPQPKP